MALHTDAASLGVLYKRILQPSRISQEFKCMVQIYLALSQSLNGVG